MKQKNRLAMASCIAAFIVQVTAMAQQAPVCKPAEQQVPQLITLGNNAKKGFAEPTARNLTIAAIPGVVAAGASWTKIWQGGGNSADGIITDKDGSVLIAQEDFDTVLKIDDSGKTSVVVANAKGLGSLSMDRQGRLYGAHRTERPGSTKPDRDAITNAITLLMPERRVITEKWTDGGALTIRPNDLAADGKGGAYFTSGCLYYASPKGVTVVGENLRTNGILLSTDDKTLYVTNGATLVAFDVKEPGVLTNRRDFAQLPAGSNGDGLAIDSEGRVYVTANPGVHVFDKTGKHLGLIPTPRGVISVGFAGRDKKSLYVVGGGADDENGQPIRQGPQLTAATVYKLPLLAQGYKGRAK